MKNLKITTKANMLLLAALSTLILSSCDPGTYYKKVVENHSTKDVKLIVNDYNISTNDTVVLKAGAIDTVYEDHHIGGTSKDKNTTCEEGYPTSFINPNDSDVVDITKSADWINQKTEKGKSLYITCRYIIDESSLK